MLNRISLIVFVCLCGLSCKNAPSNPVPHPTIQLVEQLADSAQLQHDKGDTEHAIFYHKRALKYAEASNLRVHQANSLLKIANLLPRRDADTSLRYLGRALNIARSLHHYELQADIYRSITEIHKQQHNYTSAIFALEAHHQLTDSLLNERRRKDLRQLQLQRSATQERTLAIGIVAGLLIIAITLGLFFRRTRVLNRKLERSVAVRNKLFSIIGHDLRGPSGSLDQAFEMIEMGVISDKELPDFLKMLKGQTAILKETLDSLLVWSRAQLDEIQSNAVLFNPLESIGPIVALLKRQCTDKELTIHVDVPAGASIFADKDQFDFIIRNLLSNAIKFSHPGGSIEVQVNPQNNFAEISVTDHGIGISAERQNAFRTGSLETTYGTSGEKGTGLGLRTVRDFVNACGGGITLQSKAGETTFCVRLPKP